MPVTLPGMLTDAKPEQPENALVPMLVTPSGMLTDVKPEQPLNALVPMLVTPMGLVVFLQPAISVFPSLDKRALHWLLFASVDLYAVLPASTVIVVIFEQ